MVRTLRYIVCLGLVGILSGCVQHGTRSRTTADEFTTSAIDKVSTNPSYQATSAKTFAANTTRQIDYRIAGLDVLEISVLGVPDLNRTVQVSAEGLISLPLVKTLQAGGLTGNELENQIAAKLAESYMQAPQVSVFIKEFNSQKITVDGAVMKPGIFPFTGNLSLLQAIALSQGLSEIADPKTILIFRIKDARQSVARFDLGQIRAGKSPNPLLLAGDIVTVDESRSRTTLRLIKDALPLTNLFQFISL
jgi:polysaccharide biosynthesis/export protein